MFDLLSRPSRALDGSLSLLKEADHADNDLTMMKRKRLVDVVDLLSMGVS